MIPSLFLWNCPLQFFYTMGCLISIFLCMFAPLMRKSMKKRIFTLFVALWVAFLGVSMAQIATPEQATLVCQRFLLDHQASIPGGYSTVKLQETYTDAEGMTCLYRFGFDGTGFVIVSASQRVMPVLAYSFDENFEMIPPVRDIFHYYEQVVRATETGDAPTDAKSVAKWERYLSEQFTPKAPKTAVRGPLLTTRWNQNKFYNTYCPWDVAAGPYYDYRVPNGCVALACAQIMNYHRYPDHATGATTYLPPGYPRQTVFFTQHHYYWDAMCNQPESYACEIAKLAYHFGVAIQMGYTADGSGAQTSDARQQMREKFGYDASIAQYDVYLNDTTGTAVAYYTDLLKNEIDLRRPVYYSGCSNTSCHAYVLDGYDDEDRFHLNYGWGGASNGDYALTNFVAGNTHYDYNASCIIRIFPSGAVPATYCQGHQRNTASFGYVADGSPTAKPYQANPDCSWMVAAPNANTYHFKFDRLDLNPNVDFVTIYNGPTVESGVAATLTGTQVPTATYNVEADSVLITFTSTGAATENNDYYGFLISYDSELLEPSCSGAHNVSDWHTILSDNSGDGTPYRAQTNCTWNVTLQYIAGYAFNFTKFDLGYGDFVDIYNANSNPPTLYQRFDIYNMPVGIYNVDFRKMKINFVSDNYDQRDGFELSYYAIDAVEDHSGLEDISVYPNPATDDLYMSFSLTESATVRCRLTDLAGRTISVESFAADAGTNLHTLNVASLAPGFYILEMSTPMGKSIRKVMVQ